MTVLEQPVTVWCRRLAAAENSPGRWVIVWRTWNRASAYAAVRDLRKGRTHTPPGRWEYHTARIAPQGQWCVCARWLGPEAD